MRLRWMAAMGAVLLATTGCAAFTPGATEAFYLSVTQSANSPAGQAFNVLTGEYQPESINLNFYSNKAMLTNYWQGQLQAVAEVPQYVIKSYVKPNVILPMTNYAGGLNRSAFYPAVWDSGIENGVRYRLGGSVQVNLILYNKGLFAQAGITRAPATWSQLARDLSRVKHYSKVPFEMGADSGFIESAYLSNGGELPSHNVSDAFDNAAGQQTLAYFRQLHSEGLLKVSSANQADSDIADGGAAAIAATSPTYDSIVQQAQQNHIALGVLPMPAGSAGHSANVVGGEEYAMFSHYGTATTQQEWNLIQWFDASNQQAYYVSQTGYAPLGPQIWSHISKKAMQANPSLAVTRAALASPYTVSNPGVSGYGAVETALSTAFTRAVSGHTTVGAALAAVDAAVHANLSR